MKNFKGSVLCQPPDDLLDSFIFGKEKISDFLVRAPGTDVDYHIRELYKYIIRPILVRAETGRYSIMHENSAYLHGYSDARTIRLAHMWVLLSFLVNKSHGTLGFVNVWTDPRRD